MTETATMPVRAPFASPAFRLTARRIDLVEAMTAACSVIKQRTPKPVLLCARLYRDDNALIAEATNLEVGVKVRLEVVQWEMSAAPVLPNAEQLLAVVRTMSDENVSLESTGDSLTVKGESSQHVLPILDPADYPPLPVPPEKPLGEIAAVDLGRLIQETIYAADTSKTRYSFNGVAITASERKLSAVATDGKQLSISQCDWAGEDFQPIVIPLDACRTLMALMVESENAQIFSTDSVVAFSMNGFELCATKIEGTPPPYKDILPTEFNHSATVGREALLRAAKEAALASGPESDGGAFVFNLMGVNVSAVNAGRKSSVRVPCKVEGGITIGINLKYVIGALSAGTSDDVSLRMTAPNRPVLFHFNDNHQCIVMPMAIPQ